MCATRFPGVWRACVRNTNGIKPVMDSEAHCALVSSVGSQSRVSANTDKALWKSSVCIRKTDQTINWVLEQWDALNFT